MKHKENKSRSGILYICLAIILVIISTFLVAKPLMKKVYPLKYEEVITSCSEKYQIDKYLIMGIISAESKFNEDAVSHKKARGLMQIKDETMKWCIEEFDISEDCNPDELNITVGCAYLRYLLDKYGNNTETALAAYNAGEGNVTKWLNDQKKDSSANLDAIPYKETEGYIKRVQKRAKIYKFLY